MALETISQLSALNATLQRQFEVYWATELRNRPNYLNAMCKQINTGTRVNRFPFPEAVLRAWVGDVGDSPQYRRLVSRYVDIEVKKFLVEGAEILITDLQDTFYNSQLMEQVNGIATQAAYQPLDRMINALVNGNSDAYYTMYDGQLLFSNSHVVGITGSAFDNLFALPLTGPNLQTIKVALSQVPLGPNGEYLTVAGSKWYLIVPSALEETARLILHNDYLFQTTNTATSSNVYRDMMELVVEERLTDANDFYVVRTSPTLMPFVNIKLPAPGADQLIPEIDPTSPAMLQQDAARWSYHSFQEVYPTHFWMMAKSVN